LRTQQAVRDVVALGAKPDLENRDFGPKHELQHAEALVLVTLLGPSSAALLASKLSPIRDSTGPSDVRSVL
jgi:hypothetical protein